MSLSTILRRGVGRQLEVMIEPSAGALVAIAKANGRTFTLDTRLPVFYC